MEDCHLPLEGCQVLPDPISSHQLDHNLHLESHMNMVHALGAPVSNLTESIQKKVDYHSIGNFGQWRKIGGLELKFAQYKKSGLV